MSVAMETGPSYQVLLYHGVHADDVQLDLRNSSGKHIAESRFDKEMRILRDARPIVTMSDIAAAHRGEQDLPHGAVAVTFDDGYQNNYAVAWPILRRYEIPATVYLTTGYVGTDKVMWTDRLEAAILATSAPAVTIETRDRDRTYDLASIEQKIAALNGIKALCKRLPNAVKDQVVDSVCRQLAAEGMPDHPLYRFMNWDQIREMDASPLITFGAHTVTHASLLKVPEDQMRREIADSLSTLSRQLGAPCRHFAYPEGQANDYNDTVIDHLRALGLDHAPSAIDGTNQIGRTDPFHIHRQMVGFEGRPFPVAAASPRPAVSPDPTAPAAALTLFGRDLSREVAIIAEIGVNHEGDLATATAMVEQAAAAGADAVKFQSYTPNRFVAADDADRLARVTRFALDEADHRHLAAVAKRAGIAFFSSAITEDWVPLIAELGAAIKIASADLTFEPVIRLAARHDRPLIVSTGAGTTAEVARMIGWVREERAAEGLAERLVVMHCVSEYPAALEHSNLLSLPFLRDEFGVPIGWSNHVIGPEASVAAVALGAAVIEVHVTDTRAGKTFHDHHLSFEPAELAALVHSVRGVRAALGQYGKTPTPAETEMLPRLRKGVVAARDLAAGTVLTREDLMFARPATEIPAEDALTLVGRVLGPARSTGEMIRRGDLS